MIYELHSAKYFTKLDLRARNYQIQVQPEDVRKMAFQTHNRHYEYLIMPFGLCNASLSFQATMNAFLHCYCVVHSCVFLWYFGIQSFMESVFRTR